MTSCGTGVGESRVKPIASPSRVWIPTGRAGSHPFGASGKDVCRAKKAGRVEHTAKCVKDMERFGVEWAPPTSKREKMEGTAQAAVEPTEVTRSQLERGQEEVKNRCKQTVGEGAIGSNWMFWGDKQAPEAEESEKP